MKAIVALALLMLSASAFAQAERTFQVQSTPTEAPCAAWVKQPDGSWLQAPNTAIIIAGSFRFAGNRVSGGGDGAILERKCAK